MILAQATTTSWRVASPP